MHLTEYCKEYCRVRSLRPASNRTYKRVVHIFLKDTGISDPRDVEIKTLVEWKEKVATRSSETTYNNYHRHMKAIFNYIVEVEGVDHNIFKVVKSYSRSNSLRQPCDLADLKKALTYLENPTCNRPVPWFWIILIKTIYYTGMRRAQICGLRWKDIDFDQCEITLRKEASKTGKAWQIPMRDELCRDIEILRDAHVEIDTFEPDIQVFNVTLFSDRYSGNLLKPSQISGCLRVLSKFSGTEISAHRIRHLFATILANHDTDGDGSIPMRLTTLQRQLGHRNIATTTAYVKTNVTAQRNMIRALNGL